MSGRAFSVALRLAVSLGLLTLLALVVAEPREIGRLITQMSPVALIAALALTAGDRVLMAFKWRMLLLARGIPLPLTTAIRAYFASSFAGLFLPVTVGADAVRIMAIRQYGVADVTASIVVERTVGAAGVVVVALAGATLMAGTLAGVPMKPLVTAICAFGALLAAAFPLSLWLTARWSARGSNPDGPLRRLAAAYGAYAGHPVVLIAFFLLSVAESLIPAVIAYVVAMGLGIDAPARLFLATIPIALMVARLPVSLGGFGVQEASFVYLAGLLGLGASDAVATMLVVDAVLIAALLPSAFDVSILSQRPVA